MPKLNPSELSALYKSSDISDTWSAGQSSKLINHPHYGYISPNKFRSMHHGKPCPFCGQHMVHGQHTYSASTKKEAINKGYEYTNKEGNVVIAQAGQRYFHPHYVTLDHRVNKARCPEQMFEYENLQIMCWKCNNNKGDNNAYELEQSFDFVREIGEDTINRYPLL